ncbi:HAMP domain-containing sensor histidine kinase [Sulfurimonas sp. C5]|uniref:sensor histidine kinase n=1 Tax=Sulfurimonas sp. C5 TaxID=3036947 RepID=UPI0024574F50|nr:HAMP domain-containing sensor histidine kinase [Sulfurimonas sp. C5]MDH4944615.1 HAMP domain-containing sensor histidine kinase [Sulfurimonas sp. C5]
MSVLKNLDINLSSSAKKTLQNFLLLYSFLTIIITGLGVYLYYSSQKEIYNQEQLVALNDYANELTSKLKELQKDTTNQLVYPWDKKFKTTLYDKDYKLLYSTKDNPTLDLSQLQMTQNMIARYLKNSDEYYLGAQYIIVEIAEDKSFEITLIRTIVLFGTIFLIFMLTVGYFLLTLLLKPMKDTLFLLDRFIKDTTHELNTPVSTILTNVELLQTQEQNKFSQKVISRIEIGAKTLSNIYDDLTFLILKHKLISQDEKLLLNELLDERVEYFKVQANMKNIEINKNYQEEFYLNIDRKKITKVIDNLLSNAIKYNTINGTIDITLKKKSLIIKDSGIGIAKENLENLFTRYARFTNTTGGFGIGLHIVKSILDEYGFSINVDSVKDEYTAFIIRF